MDILIQVLLLALGFIMLIKGADWFVDGSASIAAKCGIPQLVIGLTIVARGTSSPEAAGSITAAMNKNADITIGNILGSNILNIFVILGLSAAITTLAVAKSTIRYETPFMIGITLLLLLLGFDGKITFVDGIILIALLVVYMIYLFRMAKNGKEDSASDEKKNINIFKSILLTILGLVLIIFGSDFTVDAATKIATAIGVSQRFIGLTIVALGTSLPELCTSVNAARKKNADIAIGNIVGSNLFNILFVVGISSLIVPVPFAKNFVFDTIVAIIAAVLLLLCCLRKKSLRRPAGILMLLCYAAYFVMIL